MCVCGGHCGGGGGWGRGAGAVRLHKRELKKKFLFCF